MRFVMPISSRCRRHAIAIVAMSALLAAGCGGERHAAPVAPAKRTSGNDGVAFNAPAVAVPTAVREQLLDGAIGVLGRLDDYDERAAYEQVFDRLNQWSHSGVPWPEWSPDPLVGSVPERFRPFVNDAALRRSTFDFPSDVLWLRDQRWLHDIAIAAAGDAVDDLVVAERLFTWTTRFLAIVADPPAIPSASNPGTRWYRPGAFLLSGRASGPQRAWVFLELVRHAGLDGAMLATVDEENGIRPWIPAVLCDGEAYLFDPGYGMPIPVGGGGMPIPGVVGPRPATVRQAAVDPSVLERMNIGGRKYPVQSTDLARMAVLVSASPESLSRRMKQLESNLAGRNAMRLCVDAQAVADRLRAALPPGGAEPARVALWDFPLETLVARQANAAVVARNEMTELASMQIGLMGSTEAGFAGRSEVRPLFIGRVRDFRGDLDGEKGAKAAYLLARPSSARVMELTAAAPEPQREVVRALYEQLKQDAAFCLGIVMLREKQYEAAVDYLGRMTLESHPDSRWADASRVLLADAFIALDRQPEARSMLEADESPQRFGSRLRAAALETSP